MRLLRKLVKLVRTMALKRDFLSLVTALCIIVNAFAPNIAYGAQQYGSLYEVMAGQSEFFKYISFSALPAMVVEKLFKDHNALGSSKDGESPSDKQEKRDTSSSQFSILKLENKTGNRDTLNLRSIDNMNYAVNLANVPSPDSGLRILFEGGGACLIMMFIVLMYFFLRARSSIGEDAARLFLYGNKTRLGNQAGFFYVSANNHLIQRSLV